MLFNSFAFLSFFPLVAGIFFALPDRFRWIHLVCASSFFYMWVQPRYILVLLLLILIDYFAAIKIEESKGVVRKLYFLVSLTGTLLSLLIFKYYAFLVSPWAESLGFPGSLALILPVGLSFHTFQSLSYVIEVYRGQFRAERHLGYYALYVLYFPQLVAGPIERPQNLLPQFRIPVVFIEHRISQGLLLMAIGFFKKLVIADRFAVIANSIFGSDKIDNGPLALLAAFSFSIQIYCDFSGYVDIARGASQVLGIELSQNFNRPYLASSIQEFWRRWHISLSTWFRDYVYLPLGGSKKGLLRWLLALSTTFVLSGLWHGANWTFMIWGALHSAFMILQLVWTRLTPKLYSRDHLMAQFLGVCLTFFSVTLAWIFFRAPNVDQALRMLKALPNQWSLVSQMWASAEFRDTVLGFMVGENPVKWFCETGLVLLIGLMVSFLSGDLRKSIGSRPVLIRYLVYYMLILTILIWGVNFENQFVYYQF